MALSDCPYDEETGLWVASSRWLPSVCQRCNCYAVTMQVTLADHNAGIEETKLVCDACGRYYIKLPKKED